MTSILKCPICGAPADARYRPFCSIRCADVDLSRWLRGGYAVPGHPATDKDGDDAQAAGAGSAGPPGEEREPH
jgi:endogenous inhibitor of DNA gyrase (YacG/DUF329 family)